MSVADAREFGNHVAGEAIFMNHRTPALHALVGILRISPRQVALQLGITPGRMSHYLNGLDPIPYDRRQSTTDLLSIILDALQESLEFAKAEAKKGKLKEAVGAPYTQASIAVAEAIMKDCRRLMELERKALKKMAAELTA